ncbi:hypothetical protein LY28_01472 [Ruminiclostridium sufflavum DSM 19573]|uniref:DUF2953 family protein n=1 Tax=Ruminiclostridium sufflavum DSM 19573 TaxID=1121337 RepID=A0A318XMY0_9FIRM|nr:DUF2953 domain-containing protein [Ruminiclostridium sufflavum]PYG88141.1 hypothetical protein LY28_01472 [Ruminiclostridium sufflavum DSM 19573]
MLFIYILLILLFILLAVLIIPFKYRFKGEKLGGTVLEGSLAWLFGGIRLRFAYSTGNGFNAVISLLCFRITLDKSRKKSKPKDTDKDKDSKRKKREKPGYSYFTEDVLKKGLNCALRTLNHCKPRQLRVQAKVGFDDPMYTGLLYGINGAGFAILDKYNIRVKPAFEDEGLEGSFLIGGSIRIGYLLLVAIEFVLTKPFRSILLKNNKIKIKRRIKTWRISVSTKA